MIKKQILKILYQAIKLRDNRRGNIIFLLGHDRSGSTWVAKTLGLADNAFYVHEPINEHTSMIGNWDLYNQHLYPGDESPAHCRIYDLATKGLGTRHVSGRELLKNYLQNPKVVVKETGGMLLGEWFEKKYCAQIIVLFRHPIPTIISNWNMEKHNAQKWLEQLLRQPKLLAQENLIDKVSKININNHYEAFAAVYCVRYLIVLNQMKINPHWTRIHYEDFCENPVENFSKLFSRYGLKFSKKIESQIRLNSSKDESGDFFGTSRDSKKQLFKWKLHIEKENILKIKKVMDYFEFPFYSLESMVD